jgi:hypothetical protein
MGGGGGAGDADVHPQSRHVLQVRNGKAEPSDFLEMAFAHQAGEESESPVQSTMGF